MLRALRPDESLRPPAYRLPWHVDGADRAHPRVTNAGGGAVDFVRVFTHSAAASDRTSRSATEHRGQILPGETVELCLCDLDLDDAVVTLAWFHPDTGVEYVWRFVV